MGSFIDGLFDAIGALLAFMYELPTPLGGSYGIAIILLTLAVMIVLMPLTLKATRSTIKMQLAAPRLKEIQKEFKDDKEAMNREVMAFYQSEGINPVGGCLPMLAQLPVFLVLFRLLRGLSTRRGDAPLFELANAVRERTGLDPLAAEVIVPEFIPEDSEMFQSLQGQTEISFGPFDLAAQAGDVLQTSFGRFIPYLLLILFVVGTSYFQQYQITARRGKDAPVANQQQQAILKFLPLMTGIWSFFFPAGLVVYWATSNLFRIGQQAYITRSIYGEDSEGKQALDLSKAAAAEKAANAAADSEDAVKSKSTKTGKITEDDKPKSAESKKKASGSGKSGSNKSGSDKSGSNGSDPSGLTKAQQREERWRARSEEARKKAEARNSRITGESKKSTSGGRTTPKGTKSDPKKKKKR